MEEGSAARNCGDDRGEVEEADKEEEEEEEEEEEKAKWIVAVHGGVSPGYLGSKTLEAYKAELVKACRRAEAVLKEGWVYRGSVGLSSTLWNSRHHARRLTTNPSPPFSTSPSVHQSLSPSVHPSISLPISLLIPLPIPLPLPLNPFDTNMHTPHAVQGKRYRRRCRCDSLDGGRWCNKLRSGLKPHAGWHGRVRREVKLGLRV
jgi:hypothetical protein